MAAAILLLVAFAAPVVSRRITGDAFGPVSLVALTWGASAALAGLAWIPYHPIAVDTWWFIVFNLLALVAGLVAGGRVAHATSPGEVAAAPADAADPLRPERWLI